ncbi:hypothetical protein Hanom_Chr01g00038061 [Helianthus anomalus]
MLYTVFEHKLGFNVQAVFDKIKIKNVEARRAEREKELAEEAKQKKKGVVNDKEVTLGTSSQHDQSLDGGTKFDDTHAEKGHDKEEEEEEEEEEKKEDDPKLKELFNDIDNFDGDNDDDDDQGATGLVIEDQHQEASSSGKQHAGVQVYLTLPKVIYLHSSFEGELEVPRSRESMLEESGMDDGYMKFDIKDEIPPSPEREYTFKFANEANNFKDVIIEEGSDVSDEDKPFHYSGVDDTFPTFAEMFKTHNEDEVRRKVVERISSEGIPEVVPPEELLEERKNWFKINLWVIFYHGAIFKIFKYMLFEESMVCSISSSYLILRHSHGGMWRSLCRRRILNNSTTVLM